MAAADDPAVERRVLVVTRFRRDAELSAQCLRDLRIPATVCVTDDAFFEALAEGAGAVLVSDDRLGPDTTARLRAWLEQQPAWSDLPLVVVVGPNSPVEAVLAALEPLGNLTPIERPMRQSALVSVVRAALRARERQYEARALLARLSETDRRKDAFIAMLGHELRNPLGAIHGAATLLDAMPDKGERMRRVSTILGRQVGHLQRLLDDLLDVARITAGKIVLKPTIVDLRGSVRQVVAMLDPMVREHGHRLDVALGDGDVLVQADPVRLDQMVANLLQNAIKYTPDGGAIRVALETHDDAVELLVSDTGRGLDDASLARIFEPFTQVENTLDRAMGGLGLGLPLVRGLASLHGGTITAQSEGLGRGSTFVLRLPLAHAVATMPKTPSQAPVLAAPAALRVLLVDDFLDVLDMLRLALETRGCIVDTAIDGRAALERATTGTYDIAFVDIGLPLMSGLDVARALRADARTARLPLVAMSGYGREEDRGRSLAAGFDDHLVKPVDVQRLLERAESLVRRPSST